MARSITLIPNSRDDFNYKAVVAEILDHPKYRRLSESDLVKQLIDTPLTRLYRRLFGKKPNSLGVTKRRKSKL
jgi:hypothetical protein